MKKILTFALSLVFILCCIPNAEVDAAILWTNISSIDLNMQSANGIGEIVVCVGTVDEESEIAVTAALYVKATSGKWIEVTPDDWETQTATGVIAYFGFTYTGNNYARYKVDITVDVTLNGYTETITDSAENSLQP